MTSAPLQALLALQDADTDLDRHRHRRLALPERQAAGEVRARQAALDAELATVQRLVDEVAGRQGALEADLTATETRIAEVNRRLYGGSVSASRDLQAMADEVKTLQGRRSDLEDRLLEVFDEREPHDQLLADRQAERAEGEVQAQALAAAIAEGERAIDAGVAVLAGQRQGLAAAVPPELLVDYERIRDRLGGVGASRLVGSRCDGCHLTLPAVEIDRLKHLPDDAIVTCEDCGRILVRS